MYSFFTLDVVGLSVGGNGLVFPSDIELLQTVHSENVHINMLIKLLSVGYFVLYGDLLHTR
jgi:hypothetical protein